MAEISIPYVRDGMFAYNESDSLRVNAIQRLERAGNGHSLRADRMAALGPIADWELWAADLGKRTTKAESEQS